MTIKSCRTCPSFVSTEDATKVYLKSPNADSCARLGRILSRPDQADEVNARICDAFGGTCDHHGEERPRTVRILDAVIGLPDPVAVKLRATVTDDMPASCMDCCNFVGPETVKSELGWTLGMCASQGRLIFPNRYVAEATDCGVGYKGPRRNTADGVKLLSEYGNGPGVIQVTSAPADFVLSDELQRHAVDPRSYESDREVTDADKAQFIRAWRQVNDPEGLHPPVFLPIYDGMALCGLDPATTYGKHRPDLYVDHQGILYDLAVEMFQLRSTPLLIGPAGTGKTEALCWVAWLMDLPFHRFSVSKGTEDWHFAGESKLEADPTTGLNVTVFREGRFTAQLDKPGVICVDEPNLKAEIYEFLRPIFDGAKRLTLDAAQGFFKEVGQHTFIGVTQNPSDDPIYVGTEPMSAADLSRVSPVYIGLPEENVERGIIRKHCADAGYELDALTLDKIMQISVTLRGLIADGALPIAWGIRDQVKVALKTRYYSIEKSYRRALVDGLEMAVVDVVLAAVRSVAS